MSFVQAWLNVGYVFSTFWPRRGGTQATPARTTNTNTMALFFQKFWRRQETTTSGNSCGSSSNKHHKQGGETNITKLETEVLLPPTANALCVPSTESSQNEPGTTAKTITPFSAHRMSKRTVPLGRGLLCLSLPVKRRKTVEERWELEKARTRGETTDRKEETNNDETSGTEEPVNIPRPTSALEKWEAFLHMCDKHEGNNSALHSRAMSNLCKIQRVFVKVGHCGPVSTRDCAYLFGAGEANTHWIYEGQIFFLCTLLGHGYVNHLV